MNDEPTDTRLARRVNLSREEKRIRIAEVCGWRWHGDATWEKHPDWYYWQDAHSSYEKLPDFFHNLNAMHEAEKTLGVFQRVDYRTKLIQGELGLNWGFATAEQRAEAFGIALGLWEGSEASRS